MKRTRTLAIHPDGAAPRRLLVALNLLTVLLVLFTLAACGSGEEQAGMATETVPVRLASHDIEMPAAVPAGAISFEVTNQGDSVHGFEVEGLGLEEEVQVPPGETRTLEVNLEPGTYRIYCPVADHSERGMELALRVLPRERAA